MMASLTDKPKQQNLQHPGGHQLKMDHENKDTGRPANGKLGLAMVNSGGLIYVQMPKVMKAITISNASERNEELEQELKQQPKDKQSVVVTAEDDEDQEDHYMPYISRGTVDGYLDSIIAHQEKYT